MDNKNQKYQTDSKLLKLQSDIKSSFIEKNKDNSINKKKCKCPELQLLRKKRGLNFNEALPYHIKNKFTQNALLNEKNDKIILISKSEYIKSMTPVKEDKSTTNLTQVSTKTKNKEIYKSHSQNNLNEEINDDNNIKDILTEISEITADLELFEMERRKRKIMKLIEVMADKLDNNMINQDQLSNLHMFDKKII